MTTWPVVREVKDQGMKDKRKNAVCAGYRDVPARLVLASSRDSCTMQGRSRHALSWNMPVAFGGRLILSSLAARITTGNQTGDRRDATKVPPRCSRVWPWTSLLVPRTSGRKLFVRGRLGMRLCTGVCVPSGSFCSFSPDESQYSELWNSRQPYITLSHD